MEVVLELLDHPPAPAVVDGHGRVQKRGPLLVLACRGPQGGDVLGQARAAPADPRTEKASPYALVEPDAVGHLRDIRADQLAEVGDLVYEADLGRKEGVGSILDHLGARQVRADEGYGHLGPRV